jgi:thioredoxin-related protein
MKLPVLREKASRMKRSSLLILIVGLLAVGAPVGQAAGDKIDWHSYESGLARSKFEKKKVFLYFHAEWCGYCRDMDLKTFKDPAVIRALNRNFIPIRVDSDREQAAASMFRVKGLPDSWFLAESGDIIGHRPGFIPADQLMKILDVVSAGSAAKKD